MDPLATLSLVSSTFQISDFLFRLIVGTASVYRSGRLDEYDNLEAIATKLNCFNRENANSVGAKKHVYADPEAKELAHDYQVLAERLIDILGTLKQRKQTVWGSFRVALNAALKKEEVERLCSDIFRLQTTLATYLQSCIL